MPYQTSGGRRNNVQLGVGQSIWAGSPPPAIPERVLDGIPGFAALMALLLTLAGAVVFPRAMLAVAALVACYTALRFGIAAIANLIGLRRIRQWEKTDWCAVYDACDDPTKLPWNAVQHIVIIPNYKEPLPVLRRTLDNLARQHRAPECITIVMAMEAAEEGCVEKAETLRAEFNGLFANFLYTVHPRGLPGEMQSKSANQAWAARWIKRTLVDELGYNIDALIVTTMDADTMWHPDHFMALTCLFATNPMRYQRFWQAPIRYHGNIWEINPLLRSVNAYSGAFELAFLAAKWWMPLPMSSYALSLRLLDSSGYWDSDVIADEWHMFIKAYFAHGGDLKLERMFTPFLAQAVSGTSFLDALKNRYLQTLRHAWGSKEVGYVLAKMLEHPEMPSRPTLRLLFRVSHDILLAGAGWVVMTIGSQLPVLLHPDLLTSGDPFVGAVFISLQVAFVIIAVLGIVFWIIDVRARPPRQTPQTWQEALLTLISFPLLSVMTLIVVAIPTLQAQLRLLIGLPLQFRVSKKT